jgi:hypothetical protein
MHNTLLCSALPHREAPKLLLGREKKQTNWGRAIDQKTFAQPFRSHTEASENQMLERIDFRNHVHGKIVIYVILYQRPAAAHGFGLSLLQRPQTGRNITQAATPALPAVTSKARLRRICPACHLLPASLRLGGAAGVYCTGGSLALVVQPVADELRDDADICPSSAYQPPTEEETGWGRLGNDMLKEEPCWKTGWSSGARFNPSVEPSAKRDHGVEVRGGAEVDCADSFAGARDVLGLLARVRGWQLRL